VIAKTYSVTHLVKESQGRYSPVAVVAVSRDVVSGDPEQYVSTSYVALQNLSLRMASPRFTRLTMANNASPQGLSMIACLVPSLSKAVRLIFDSELFVRSSAKILLNWSLCDRLLAASRFPWHNPTGTTPKSRLLWSLSTGLL